LLVLLINLPLFYLLLLAWHWRSTTTLITYMDAAFFWFTAHISIFRGLHAILNKEEEKKLCPIWNVETQINFSLLFAPHS
jgi:hypothetical protein